MLDDAREDAPAGADRAPHRSADLRPADAGMVADRDLDDSHATQRSLDDHLDGPPVGQLAQLERAEHVVSGSSERTEVGERETAQKTDQSRREPIAEHRMARQRAIRAIACESRADHDVGSTVTQRLEKPRQLGRTIAVVAVEEHHHVGARRLSEPGETGAAVAALGFEHDSRAATFGNVARTVARVAVDDEDLGDVRPRDVVEHPSDRLRLVVGGDDDGNAQLRLLTRLAPWGTARRGWYPGRGGVLRRRERGTGRLSSAPVAPRSTPSPTPRSRGSSGDRRRRARPGA